MNAEGVVAFLRRAEDFSRGMALLRDEPGYAQSAALLAVHSAIAYADALRVGLGETILASDDHGTAVKALRQRIQGDDAGGLDRLRRLVGMKHAVAYEGKRASAQQLLKLCVESERFALWANKIGTERPIAGWVTSHD